MSGGTTDPTPRPTPPARAIAQFFAAPAWRLMYTSYRLSSSIRYWAERRLTPAGWIISIAAACCAMVGPDTENNVAYQGFTLLFCLLIIALAFSFIFKVPFSAQRRLPRFGSVGHPLRYQVEVSNLSHKIQKDLTVFDEIADPRPSYAEWRAVRAAEDRRDRPFRITKRQQRQSFRTVEIAPAELPPIGPGETAEVTLQLQPKRRGVVRFKRVALSRTDPLGIFRSMTRFVAPQSILILPRRYPLPPIPLPGSMRYQDGGIALASHVGQSDEFVALRDYRYGDAMRHIHWRTWAKAGKPVVKEFEDEFFVRHALILDTFTDDPRNEAFEEAISVASSFACTLPTQESLLDLLFVGAQSYCFTAGRGLAHGDQMLEILASVNAAPLQKFSALEELVLNHLRVVSGCICVLQAWDAPRQNLVRKMRALGVPVLVLLVLEAEPSRPVEPGVMRDDPSNFHVLISGDIEAGLLRLQVRAPTRDLAA